MSVTVQKCFWKLRFLGVFVWVPGYKVLQRIFFIPWCIHFWCVSDVALHWNKCLTAIKLTKKWLTSPIEASHVEKSLKKWTKVFAEGIFVCVPRRIFLWAGQRRNVQRICLQSFKAVPFSYLDFFPKEGHSAMMDTWTDILLPRSLFLAALLRITCCCYGFMACIIVNDFNFLAGWTWLAFYSHSSEARVEWAKRAAAMWSSLTGTWQSHTHEIQWLFSLLFWAHKRKNSVSFNAKSNFNPFSSHMWKMSPFEELQLVPMIEIKYVKDFTFGSGCTVLWLHKSVSQSVLFSFKCCVCSGQSKTPWKIEKSAKSKPGDGTTRAMQLVRAQFPFLFVSPWWPFKACLRAFEGDFRAARCPLETATTSGSKSA